MKDHQFQELNFTILLKVDFKNKKQFFFFKHKNFKTLGQDVNIALQLVDEGFAFIERNFISEESSQVLRLDGGSKSIINVSTPEIIIETNENGNQSTDRNQNTVNNGHPYLTNEKFSAIIENTVNENFENVQRDSTNNSTNGFLEHERHNGGSNKVPERST